MDVQLPDGTVIKGVPDGISKADLTAKLKTNGYDVSKLDAPSAIASVGQQVGNTVAGAVRGAGSIGATLLAPYDMARDALDGKGLSLESNRQRRADMDSALGELGADTDSLAFKGGKLGTEIAGTLGVGGAIANTAARVPQVAAAAPNLLNAIRTAGMTAGPPGGAVNALTRAAGGAINGGVSAGLVDPSQAGTGAAVGGALPGSMQLAGKAGSAIGGALRGAAAAPEVVALAKRAKDLGIDIPADRLVNSKPLNALASALNYVPLSGRAATEATMESQLNIAASRLIGQDTPNMTKAIRDASKDLGAKFDTTLKGNGVAFDQQLLNDVAAIENTAQKELGADGLKAISGQIDELVAKGGNGTIDGQAAYNIKRTLDRIGQRNTPEAFHALELKRALMGALDRSLGPTEAAAFAETRRQYGNMIALEKIAKNGAEGDISVARLANMRNINNDPLQELADIAAQFVKAREGQHGAMQRAAAGAVTAATAGPAGLAALAAGGRATNMALNTDAARALVTGQTPNALAALANPTVRSLAYRSAPAIAADR